MNQDERNQQLLEQVSEKLGAPLKEAGRPRTGPNVSASDETRREIGQHLKRVERGLKFLNSYVKSKHDWREGDLKTVKNMASALEDILGDYI